MSDVGHQQPGRGAAPAMMLVALEGELPRRLRDGLNPATHRRVPAARHRDPRFRQPGARCRLAWRGVRSAVRNARPRHRKGHCCPRYAPGPAYAGWTICPCEPGLRRIGTCGDPRRAVRRSRAQQRHRHDMQPQLAGHRLAADPRDGRTRPWTTRIAEQNGQRPPLPKGETESGRRTLKQSRPVIRR